MSAARTKYPFLTTSLLILGVSCGQALLGGEKVGLDAATELVEGDTVSLLQVAGRQVLRERQWQPLTGSADSANPRAVRNQDVPELVVDLDASPERRWQNVTRHYLNLGVFPDCCREPKDVGVKVLLEAAKAMPLADEYLQELEGIVADIGHPDVTVPMLILTQVAYEFGISVAEAEPVQTARTLNGTGMSGCSGVLAAKRDGTVIHGRNMDLEVGPFETASGRLLSLSEVTVDVLFVKGGKPFIVSTHWPGQTGYHTAMRFDGWSISQNTRAHGVGRSILYGLLKRSEAFMLGTRQIMETTPDFETAVQKLYDFNWMAPQYFIVAGPGPFQGTVITVDHGGAHLVGTPPLLRLTNHTPVLHGHDFEGGWHLVQTNDDHFSAPADDRRPQEELRLTTVSQDAVSTDWVLSEMLAPALFTEHTPFTTVYVPSVNYYKTYAHPHPSH